MEHEGNWDYTVVCRDEGLMVACHNGGPSHIRPYYDGDARWNQNFDNLPYRPQDTTILFSGNPQKIFDS